MAESLIIAPAVIVLARLRPPLSLSDTLKLSNTTLFLSMDWLTVITDTSREQIYLSTATVKAGLTVP